MPTLSFVANNAFLLHSLASQQSPSCHILSAAICHFLSLPVYAHADKQSTNFCCFLLKHCPHCIFSQQCHPCTFLHSLASQQSPSCHIVNSAPEAKTGVEPLFQHETSPDKTDRYPNYQIVVLSSSCADQMTKKMH